MVNSPSMAAATAIAMLLVLLVPLIQTADAQVGVCYGRNGNNLPSEQQVVSLYQSNGIGRMRIYDPDQEALQALKGSNIEPILDVPNDSLQSLASDASQWVESHVAPFASNVNFRCISVGNEVEPSDSNAQYVLPAMQNVRTALNAVNLGEIPVSTAIKLDLLETTFPPSASSFSSSAAPYITPIINFLNSSGAPLLANIYPYFSYVDNSAGIAIDYALFTSPGTVVTDSGNGLQYQNLFDAMVDSLYAALSGVGGQNVAVVVSESGWPSDGGTAATTDNAATYIKNLINHVKGGTPRKPGGPLETYLFAMFDENQKPAGVEQHFGLCNPDGTPNYQISFNYAQVGVCYGRNGNNLPSEKQVAFRGSNIELILDVPNDRLKSLASDASLWVRTNVVPFAFDVNFSCISVGNEVEPSGPNAHYVLPAVRKVRTALNAVNLGRIPLSTAINIDLLGNSYPPSAGSFSSSAAPYITPIINFFSSNGAPLLANIFPYFSYVDNAQSIDINYALFTSPGTVVTDAGNGLQYQNLFDAMVDSLYAAMSGVGGQNVAVVVSESGWPSDGGTAATTDNAAIYIKNLINHVKGGTPRKPGGPFETYLFALFDENQKAAGVEQHFGLFNPDGTPNYQISFN
ncbi:hypothetical protein Nepgr_001860 [Nepenthes gracilis]|uniref:Glucan endo-1,3-beta-D-glucosidase n=1 Tax=Nepenthes gracilis TaxID=150966 RepID=A0AAD3RXT6_NEPGR|nr:hypothetical protein Nepgr_001860 [Nepenthes gracilis]